MQALGGAGPEETMNIIIPSSGRAFKQTTLNTLPTSLTDRVRVVVPDTEAELYSAQMRCRAEVVPCPRRGIGLTRQWILENYGPKVVMLDDDLVFATRREDEPDKFVESSDAEVERMFEDIENLLNRYVHVGVGTREGGNYLIEQYPQNMRMLRILAYRADKLKELGVRFDEMDVMEDFDVTLTLLRKGYPNKLVNWIVHNQNGSGLSGGCSQYRTMDVQAVSAHRLKARHDRFVTVVEKETKGAWGGGVRTDVKIYWKRAISSAGVVHILD